MTNLVVCCDGTWNTPDNLDHGLPAPTNVVKLYNALKQGDDQQAYYHPGVGTGKGWWDHAVGGGTGDGLDENIMSAYRWLATKYTPGDDIFVFGFSRGAYTARSLCGLIGKCGLMDMQNEQLTPDDSWARVREVFSAYRNQHDFENPNDYTFHKAPPGDDPKLGTPIHFIGVWDTVGALGIPEDFALLGLFDRQDKYRFHDTKLSDSIKNARHAVAIDEKRASFEPTLWSSGHPGMKQQWFPGVHSDVGGGYFETGLSDGALKWMLDEATGCGLKVWDGADKQIHPDSYGIIHDSCSGVFKLLKTQPRAVPSLSGSKLPLHKSTQDRKKRPSLVQGEYWKEKTLAKSTNVTVNVFAAQHWNITELYLEAGEKYEFKASGQWIDKDDAFSPSGKETRGFHFGDIVRFAGSMLGEAEKAFQKVTGQTQPDFWGTKRYERAPWFSLIGFVASEFGRNDRMLPTGEMFEIGEGTTYTPKKSGYLYCFANDAWQTYGNNRGSVALSVKHL